MLSLVELIRSRSVIGSVVDSVGLQLISLDPDYAATDLNDVTIDPRVAGDSIMLDFAANKVTGAFAGRTASAGYGQVLRFGAVQFRCRPARPWTMPTSLVIPREAAIGALRQTLLVTPHTGTDVIEIDYQSTDPRLAARIVNNTVSSFRTLNLESARDKSRRRRIFLEQQFDRTDSLLNRAQAELANFRSRQQLASSASRLEAEQTAMIALEGRRSELEADRNTYVTLLAKLKTGSDAGRAEALRALATSPALGDNPSIGSLFNQLNNYQFRLDSMTTGPWAAAPTNPDVIQLRTLITNAQANLTQAVSSHVTSIDARMQSLGALRAAERPVNPAPPGHGRRGDATQPARRGAERGQRSAAAGLSEGPYGRRGRGG